MIRGDSGFCREAIMAWCEANNIDFVLGLAKNERLVGEIAAELAEAKEQSEQAGASARVFKDFLYQTRESWTRSRRVIGKAEHLAKGANPRFVVTSLSTELPHRWCHFLCSICFKNAPLQRSYHEQCYECSESPQDVERLASDISSRFHELSAAIVRFERVHRELPASVPFVSFTMIPMVATQAP